MDKGNQKELQKKGIERPPIIVVMGHIDHGKTTLLDFIRKTKVAEKESGGITQHIGAYAAEHKGKKLTFIDTPGHEAFAAMRARGARVADLAVLVVSAEDSVKQQTKEAIAILKETETPFVVAINKIDKPNADTGRTKKDLAENDVLIEEYGGKIPCVAISAKSGEHVDALLDTLLLMAELEELTWDPASPARGVVVESHTDPKRGKSATLLIRDGAMRRGEFLAMGGAVTPVRAFEDFRGEAIAAAGAGDPVRMFGLAEDAAPGEEFGVFPTKAEAEEYLSSRPQGASRPQEVLTEDERAVLHIILKTDVRGSQEALEEILGRLQFSKVGNRVVKSETGDINESDVKTAAGGRAVIVGFRVRVSPAVQELADIHGVTIIARDIIYELEDAIRKEMLALVAPEVKRTETGRAKVLALFRKEKYKQVIGGKVSEGVIKKGARFDIERNKTRIGGGKALGLQQAKRDTESVAEGLEFGMLAEAEMAIVEGDFLVFFEEEKIAPALE